MPEFYIDAREVTNAEYYRFVKATSHRAPVHWDEGMPVPGTEDHPVVNVSYDDASAYATWCGKRLPTEVEWERAARGASGFQYPYGNEYNPHFANTGGEGTKPVGSYASRLMRAGISQRTFAESVFDMSGNAAEWTASVYDAFDYDLPIGSDGRYNPYQTTLSGPFRVVRGGSFRSSQATATAVHRGKMHHTDLNDHTGFRCVVDRKP